MKDIKIIGAGLSGLTAAINLARAGTKVEVFEMRPDVGERFHGDFQGLENWSETEDVLESLAKMNIEINFACHPFTEVIFSNGEKETRLNFKKPLFYLVRRGNFRDSLDQGLKNQALGLGVKINFKKTLPKEKAQIIATGPILSEISAIAKGVIFKTDLPNVAYGLVNEKAAVKGYSYLLVKDHQGCLCSVLFAEFNKVNSCFEETKRIFGEWLKLNIREPKPVGGVGCFSTKNVFREKNILYTGEAAGLQDGLAGFGMRSAITSGFLAARSIINGEDYEEIAKKHFAHKLQAGVVNRFLWEKFVRSGFPFIIKWLERSKDPFRFLHSMYNFNYIQRFIFPPAHRYVKKRYPNLRL